jgi:hypothetical protein
MTVPGFTHATGAHCGSASLRDLAGFYGWSLDEPACFGVGAGLGFTYVERARDLADEWSALGGTLREASEADDPAALFERAGDEAATLANGEAAFHRAVLDAVDGPGG